MDEKAIFVQTNFHKEICSQMGCVRMDINVDINVMKDDYFSVELKGTFSCSKLFLKEKMWLQ